MNVRNVTVKRLGKGTGSGSIACDCVVEEDSIYLRIMTDGDGVRVRYNGELL